jgi:hypothetical protein
LSTVLQMIAVGVLVTLVRPAWPQSAAPSTQKNKNQYVVESVSIFDSPAVPDRGGNSVLLGLITGKGLTGILPNLKVCVRSTLESRPKLYCTETCPRSHQCLDQPFLDRLVLGPDKPIATVFVLNQDQSGVDHKIASFVVEPTLCSASDGGCAEAADKSVYGNDATVTIGFNTPWACPSPHNPLAEPTWTYGKHLDTTYARVWTDYCLGVTLDGIMFELLADNPPSSRAESTPNLDCDVDQANPSRMHIIQFVSTYCDNASHGCGAEYPTKAGERLYGHWYLDDGGGATPCLRPDRLVNGAHVVTDEPSANLPNGTALTKRFTDFIMLGANVMEVIQWSRQGRANPVQRGGRQMDSTYNVSWNKTARGDQTLRNQICSFTNVPGTASNNQRSDRAVEAIGRYMGCSWAN